MDYQIVMKEGGNEVAAIPGAPLMQARDEVSALTQAGVYYQEHQDIVTDCHRQGIGVRRLLRHHPLIRFNRLVKAENRAERLYNAAIARGSKHAFCLANRWTRLHDAGDQAAFGVVTRYKG